MTGWSDFLLLCFLFNPTWTRFVVDRNARDFIVDPNARRGIQSDVYIVSNRANIRIHHDGDRYKVRRRLTPDGLRPSLSAAGKTDVTKVALSGDGSIGTYNQRRLNGGNRNQQPIPNDKNMDVQIVSNDDFIKRKTNNKGRSDIEQPAVDDQLGSNNVANGESNVIQSALKNGIVNGHQAANINDMVSQSTVDGSSVNKQSVSNGGTDNGLQIKIKQPVIDTTHRRLKSRVEQGDVLISRKDNGQQFSIRNGQANGNTGMGSQLREQMVGGSDGRVSLIGLNLQNQGQNINDGENGQTAVTTPAQNQDQNGMQFDNTNSGNGQNGMQSENVNSGNGQDGQNGMQFDNVDSGNGQNGMQSENVNGGNGQDGQNGMQLDNVNDENGQNGQNGMQFDNVNIGNGQDGQDGMKSNNLNSGNDQNGAQVGNDQFGSQFETDETGPQNRNGQTGSQNGNEQIGSEKGIGQFATSTETIQTSPQENFNPDVEQQGTDETSTEPSTFSTEFREGGGGEAIPTTPPTTPAVPTDVETTFMPVTGEQEQEETRVTPIDGVGVTTTPQDETGVGKTRRPRQHRGGGREEGESRETIERGKPVEEEGGREVDSRDSKKYLKKRHDGQRTFARDEDDDWWDSDRWDSDRWDSDIWESDSWEVNSWDSDSSDRNVLSGDRHRKVNAVQPFRPYFTLRRENKLKRSDESDSSDWDSEIYSKEDTKTDNYDTRKTQVLKEEGEKRNIRMKKRVNYESSSDNSFWDSFEDSDSDSEDRLIKPVKTKLIDENQTNDEQPTGLRKQVRRSRKEYPSESTESDFSDGVHSYKDNAQIKQSKFQEWGVMYDDSDSWDDSDSGYWEDSESGQKRFNKPAIVKSKPKSNVIYDRRSDDDDSWYSDSWEDSSEPRRTSTNVKDVNSRLTDSSSTNVKTDNERKDYNTNRLRRGDNDFSWESDSSWENDDWEYYDDPDEYESKAKTQLEPAVTAAPVGKNEIRRKQSFVKQYDDDSDNGNIRLRFQTVRRSNRVLDEPTRSDSKRRLHFKLSGRVLLNRPNKKANDLFDDYETSENESEFVRPLKKSRRKSSRKSSRNQLFLLDTTK
ncbi:Hypothetical predicted protein [Mytilus galloprovincialis]|uniref:Uncharacterized protein n=1 Tax=Mytilus galloprovincialis TaxID=29158 RepID=A0A8B6DHU1_MYTGA|nr:Hypothetical predicted protein [Mytilus galloprovincialis]